MKATRVHSVAGALRPSWLRKTVLFYTTHFPLQKGKGRVVYWLRRWLRAADQRAVVRRGTGYLMDLDLSDYLQEWIYFFGFYERPLAQQFLSLLRPGMAFVDAGAHVGQFTLLAAKAVGPAGRVYSFEPEPGNFQRLSHNLRLNGLDNVTTFNCALGAETGRATLYCEQSAGPKNSGTHSLQPRSRWRECAEVGVEIRKLDDVLGPARVDVVKIDVEGAELLVLRGAQEMLKRWRPVVAFECEEESTKNFGFTTPEVKRFLAGLGYELYRIPREGRTCRLTPVSTDAVERFSIMIALPGQTVSAPGRTATSVACQ